MTDASAALDRARAAVSAAAETLAAAGARTEVLAAFEPERRVLGVRRAPRMRVLGRVWRLGALLVDERGALFAVGRVVRAERPARRSVTAESVAEQRAYRAAAVKGGIAEGETVDFDVRPIGLGGDAAGAGGDGDDGDRGGGVAGDGVPVGEASDGPVVVRDGRVMVRWNPSDPGALVELECYLAERVELLADPPQGG